MTPEEAERLGRYALDECGFDLQFPGVLTMPDVFGRQHRRVANNWHLDSGLARADPFNAQGCAPDFRDDATMGCLLGQVRRVWGDPRTDVCYYDNHQGTLDVWVCEAGTTCAVADTYVEALLGALKAVRDRSSEEAP